LVTSIAGFGRVVSSRRRGSVIARADSAVQSGQLELALMLYRQALDRNPHNPPIWVQCGHLLKHSGDLRAAEAAYLRAFAQDPSSRDAARELRALGWAEDRLGQLRETSERGSAAADLGTDRNTRKPTAGLSLAFWGRRTSVITLADRARDAGQLERAGRLYRKALRRNPKNAAIWIQYGHVLKGLGELDRAEWAYRQAIVQQPTSSDAQFQLGHILKLRRHGKAAQAAYLRALVLDPTAEDAPSELAGLGWSERALAELRRAAFTTELQPAQAAAANAR
jgi:tetratricopeptide (TPR) repeat protein